MGINISHTNGFQFENQENLRNAARNILNKQSGDREAAQKIIEKTIFDTKEQWKDVYSNSQLNIIKASAQMSLKGTLKETLKYLKNQSNKKIAKEPILGELWDLCERSEDLNYSGELFDFEPDSSAHNIFAA